jgi:hypothetical protein
MVDEFPSMEINWEYMLSRFWCSHHMKEAVIVNRGPGVFVLHCGCAYRMDPNFGVEFINTTAPSTENPALCSPSS